ncbi:MAG: hypothetical protein U9R10_02405, partial [Euryarchaeota archaeon]|nr:hypothetical protein [Euryarchaeota archaeon]
PADYETIDLADNLEVIIGELQGDVKLINRTKDNEIELTHSLSQLDAEILKTGGKLPWVKAKVVK